MNEIRMNDMQTVLAWLKAHPEGALLEFISKELGFFVHRTKGALHRLREAGHTFPVRAHGYRGGVHRWFAVEHAPEENKKVIAFLALQHPRRPREKTHSGSGQFATSRSYGEFAPLDGNAYFKSLQQNWRRA